ncbi:MAG: InlB B-repeat-containing protein, partial [Defluviitaleaceae bacterium]|nr:InlB B-repeat-containing protein [Defluviitaleaceae bacterium]
MKKGNSLFRRLLALILVVTLSIPSYVAMADYMEEYVPNETEIGMGTYPNDPSEAIIEDDDDDGMLFIGVEPANFPVFTVTFEPNGGLTPSGHRYREVMEDSSIEDTPNIGMPIPPERFGFTFYAWNESPLGTGQWFTDTTQVFGDITVYAIWGYVVTFRGGSVNLNIGNDPMNPADYVARIAPVINNMPRSIQDTDSAVWPNDPALPAGSLDFQGWFGNPVLAAGMSFDETTVIDSNVYIYPHFNWRAVRTITFIADTAYDVNNLNHGRGTIHEDHRPDAGDPVGAPATRDVITDLSIGASFVSPHNLNNTARGGWGNSAPRAVRNWTFLEGWWTEPGGQGTRVMGPAASTLIAFYSNHGDSNIHLGASNVVIPGTGDINLYAFWQYQVNFYPNGGQGGTVSRRISAHLEDSERTIAFSGLGMPAMTRPGFDFVGWKIAPSTGVDNPHPTDHPMTADTMFNENTIVTGNVRVFAQWEATGVNYARVTFDTAGGIFPNYAHPFLSTNRPLDGQYSSDRTYFTSYRVPLNAALAQLQMPVIPQKPGYVFVGWYEAGSSTRFAHSGMGSPRFLTENITVYATWEPYFTVTFQPNGGTGFLATRRIAQGRTWLWMNTMTSNSGWASSGAAISPWPALLNISRGAVPSGFTVADSWTLQPDTLGPFFATTTVINEDMNLYARWQTTRIFDSNLPGFAANTSPISTQNNVLRNRTFNNHEPALVAPGTPAGWQGMPSNIAQIIDDFIFVDWNTERDGSGQWFNPNAPITTGNNRYFAVWIQGVAFHPGAAPAGTIYEDDRIREIIGGNIQTVPDPVWTGQEFIGWFTTPSGNINVMIDINGIFNQSQTLFARWRAEVTFDSGVGVLEGGTPTVQVNALDTLGQHGIHRSATRSNWDFAGWYLVDGSNETLHTATTQVLQSTTLNARWDANITFNPQGGTIGGNAGNHVRVVREGDSPGTAPIPAAAGVRDGYTFVGWFTEPNWSGQEFDPTAPIVDGHQTFYAAWTRNFTVTIQNGGTNHSPTTPNNTFTAGDIITLAAGTREGYTFVNWG